MPASKYTKKLYEFLEKHRVQRGNKMSHYSMGKPVGCFYISGSKRDRLNRLYSRALLENTNLHILEKHRSQGPIIFDIDLKYKSDGILRHYNFENIKSVVDIYNTIIKKYLDVKSEYFFCFITEKEKPSKSHDDILKDGFHGIYPNICASNDLQYIIRSEVVEHFEKINGFSNIEIINSYDDIFDMSIIENNGWFLYGSGKPNRTAYELTYLLGEDLELYEKNQFNRKNLPEVFSIRKFGKEDLCKYNKDYDNENIKNIFNKLDIKRKKVSVSKRKSREYTEDDIEYAGKLVKILSSERAEDYFTWRDVGMALHNMDELLIDCWIEFSMLSSKFQIGTCEKYWDKFMEEGTRGVGLGSLAKWASEDNLEEYNKLRNVAEDNIIRHSISGTSGDVARSFYHINKGKFKCANIRQSTWYEFKDHRWCPLDSANTIQLMLNDDYPKKYKKVADYFYYRCQQLEGDEKKLFEIKREAALKTAEKLTTNKFKKDVIDELKHRFYDKEFYEKLDENKDLICFVNGIYDLKNDFFRDGYPEDYISLCTNIEYDEYDKDNEFVKQVEDFFTQIQPEKEMKNYVLDFFASCLQGHSPDELFNIWTGGGGNGKSVCIGLLQSILGDYATTISITLLTGRRAASNAASPELAKCKGVRFVVFQEPENDDKIHVGHMKELTGNDKISARALFKEPVDFYPQFKTVLTCNKLPFIPSNDGGTWRRIRVAPFEIYFVNNPKEPNERKKDRNLKSKMEKWKSGFMSILINRFRKYKKNGLIEPMKVKSFTLEYQKSSDTYLEFINEQIEFTTEKKNRINLTTLYSEFKSWFKEAHTERKCPSRNEFKSNLEEKFGKMKSYGWQYMKIKCEEMEDSDSDTEKNILDKSAFN
jgi:P4 family phage/plasmid primase-like protien